MSEAIKYVSEFFYPNLYTPEEAWVQKGLVKPDLWPLAADVCFAAGKGNLYVARVHPQGHSVLLVNKYGFPAVELVAQADGYVARNWYRYVKQRGRDRHSVHSAKRPYVVKTIAPFLSGICAESIKVVEGNLVSAGRSVFEYLDAATDNATSIANAYLKAEDAYAALRLIFDPSYNQLQVAPLTLNKLKVTYEDLTKRFANKKSYGDRVKDMFNGPKWMIARITMYGMDFLTIGVVDITTPTPTDPAIKLNFEIQPSLYRGLSDFYTRCPEHENSVKAALTFAKIFREKDPNHAKSVDPEGLLPAVSGVYEDISGIAFCSNYIGASLTAPHVLLLQK